MSYNDLFYLTLVSNYYEFCHSYKKNKKNQKKVKKRVDKRGEKWYSNKAVAGKARDEQAPWKLNNDGRKRNNPWKFQKSLETLEKSFVFRKRKKGYRERAESRRAWVWKSEGKKHEAKRRYQVSNDEMS